MCMCMCIVCGRTFEFVCKVHCIFVYVCVFMHVYICVSLIALCACSYCLLCEFDCALCMFIVWCAELYCGMCIYGFDVYALFYPRVCLCMFLCTCCVHM